MGNTTGTNNTCVGAGAGYNNGAGANNTFIGHSAGNTAVGLTNATAIGYQAQVTASNSMALGGAGANAVNVGIGTSAPQAELEVNGFTMLGSDAPRIKMKKLTGTTAAADGGFSSVPHGLAMAKILAVSVLVEASAGNNWIPPNFSWVAGWQYTYTLNNANITVYNLPGVSAGVLSKPIKILVTYEE
ncbi:MAG: hypothetical protein IPH53_04025 [Flavobacteriales bacterium]|nr:hypothetical protein [Flavobacteriales bacterium]